MIRLVRLLSTSIGDKLFVALSGGVLITFLLGHMLGNLALFQGQDALNGYAAWLQGHPLVWFFRFGLVVIFLTHVLLTVRLILSNRRARPQRYQHPLQRNVSTVSRYMAVTGSIVLAFLLFHLAHLTFGAILPENHALLDSSQRHDVYTMVVRGFHNPWISGSYVLAILLLGMHLLHGAASLFQTLGISHESYSQLIRWATYLLVAVIVGGFCSIPTLVYLGFVPPGA